MTDKYTDFKNKYGIILNDQQDAAVQAIEGPVLLLAVPGSGKTTVLVSRLGYMIYEQGIDPGNVLTITYTVAATADMKARFVSKFGDEFADRVEFRTINGICQLILNYFGRITGKKPFDLADKKANEIIKTVFKEINKSFATESDIKNISTAISYAKNMCLTQEEIDELKVEVDNFSDIYSEYNRLLKENSLIDYDDQMVYAYKILKNTPAVLEHFQNLYRYICVDEAQDTSKIQHMIIQLLANKYNNLFMVGDEDQSIYGFRAAYPQGLLDFEKNHSNAKVLLMESNYRSRSEIVVEADAFIQKNKYRHKKTMRATRESGGCIRNIELSNRRNQYNYLLKVAKDCKIQTAVLYRNNESVIPLIDLLDKNNVSYNLKKSDMVFFSHPVVTDILDILRFSLDPTNPEIFMRIYYKMGIPLKKVYAQQMANMADGKQNVFSYANQVKDMPAYSINACKYLINDLNYIAKATADKAIYSVMNKLAYDSYITDHGMDYVKADILQLLSNNISTVTAFLDRIVELQGLFEVGKSDRTANFILSTMHSSKGIEYDQVYLMDMLNGVMPSDTDKGKKKSESEEMLLEEERRLFYVAMTRAKEQLHIFTFKDGSTSDFCKEVFKINEKKHDAVVTLASSPKNMYRSLDILRDIVPAKDVKNVANQFKPGAIVSHRSYGVGQVVEVTSDMIIVLFDSGKTAQMLLSYVIQKGILTIIN